MVSKRTTLRAGYLAIALFMISAPIVGVGGVAAQQDSVTLVTVNDTVRVHPAEAATVHGDSGYEAGTNLTVVLQSSGDTSPRFIKTETVSVQDDGSFTATFNLSEFQTGRTFSVTVRRGDSVIAERGGKVVAEDVPVTPTGTATGDATPSTETTGPGLGVLSGFGALCLAMVLLRD